MNKRAKFNTIQSNSHTLPLPNSNIQVTFKNQMQVIEYIRVDGSIPFRQWFNNLAPQAAAKVSVALVRMEQGNLSNIKWFSGLGECKIDWGPGYRIYIVQDGDDLIVLFGGGTKKSQRRDIAKAKDLLREYKIRRSTWR